MRKLMLFALLACISAAAQNFTTVTASNLSYANGTKVDKGTIIFVATDSNDKPIPFQVGGGGQVVDAPVPAAVVNGAFSIQLANPEFTTPQWIFYRVTVAGAKGTLTYRKVQFSGATYDFDSYSPTTATMQMGQSVSILTVGNLIVTTSCVGCSGARKWIPSGAIDGVNRDFVFGAIPTDHAKFLLYRNGVAQSETDDYTIAGTTVTMLSAPKTGDKIQAFF